jgi:hypothetical protein
MKPRHGANWLHYASRAQGGSAGAALDEYGLLKTMIDNWREVFDEAFGRNEKHRVRNFTSMALEARNAISHLSLPIQDNEALRYLDAIHQLLTAVKAPAGVSTAARNQSTWRRESRPVQRSIFCPRMASLFGQDGPLLRPDLRSPKPARAAAVKEARRASRSGAQRP